MRRLLLGGTVGLILLGGSGCADRDATATGVLDISSAAVPEPGAPLYGQPRPATTEESSTQAAPADDPIVIPDCRLGLIDKRDVPSEHDGVLTRVLVKEGDIVKAGQLLAVVDDRLARDDLAVQEAKIKAAIADRDASAATRDEAEVKYHRQQRLMQQGATSQEELDSALLMWQRYKYECIGKGEAVTLAERERNKAQTTLHMHEIHSPIDGVIKSIFHKPGEAVKSAPSYEPMFQIYNLSRLRAEGLLNVEYLPRLRRTQSQIIIEPSIADAAQQTLIGHLQEVTGVAISRPEGQTPGYIISSSADGTVRVWDRASRSEKRVLRHPCPVRAVACTGSEAKQNWLLSGGADGVARLWEVDHLTAEPLRELKGGHRRAITCVAFSPDGQVCATGGDDHEVCLWNAATGDRLYTLPKAHRSSITAVHFLPYSQLLTAGRDNTLRLWTLGKQSARLDLTLDHRSGDVAVPGASADGQRVLFDQGRSLRVLSLPAGSIRGVVENPRGSANFTGFALFSPDGRLMLTASGSDGHLQLWRSPNQTSARASEVRQLIAPDSGRPTCAAFAPDGSFTVVGASERQVLVWPTPNAAEIEHRLTAKLTFLEGAVDSSARQVRLWAEFENPQRRLVPGTTATVVIETAAKNASYR